MSLEMQNLANTFNETIFLYFLRLYARVSYLCTCEFCIDNTVVTMLWSLIITIKKEKKKYFFYCTNCTQVPVIWSGLMVVVRFL